MKRARSSALPTAPKQWKPFGGRHAAAGTVQELPGLPTNIYSQARAINNRGDIVGTLGRPPSMRAFLWNSSGVRDLGVLPGDLQSEALAINESGDAVGWSRGSEGTRAVLWSAGEVRDLGALREDIRFARARAINARGDIVGDSISDHHSRAFVWTRDRGLQDLNDLIPAGSPFVLAEAVAINDRGYIVAVGQEHDHDHDEENEHGPPVRLFLLVPAR